jgi:hypothetical protein
MKNNKVIIMSVFLAVFQILGVTSGFALNSMQRQVEQQKPGVTIQEAQQKQGAETPKPVPSFVPSLGPSPTISKPEVQQPKAAGQQPLPVVQSSAATSAPKPVIAATQPQAAPKSAENPATAPVPNPNPAVNGTQNGTMELKANINLKAPPTPTRLVKFATVPNLGMTGNARLDPSYNDQSLRGFIPLSSLSQALINHIVSKMGGLRVSASQICGIQRIGSGYRVAFYGDMSIGADSRSNNTPS